MSSAASPPPSGASRPSRRNTGTVLVVVAVVVAVIAGFVALGLLVGGSDDTSAAPATGSGCTAPPSPPSSPEQFPTPPSPALAESATWQVTLQTNCGPIVMELDGKSAPQTVASFLFLSEKHFYDDVPCHRLTTAAQGLFVLQCGDPTGTGSGGPGYGYGIENAPPSGAYPAGTVAMARTQDPNSNGSQFFIVYADTTLPTDGGGYSIFGRVVSGLPIVKAVAKEGLAADGTAPKQPVSILSVAVKKL
ncbi:MAG: peptidylprolyl isomerase [Nocardioidaceae bacterium]